MYLGYDQNGNIIRYGHGEERLMGAAKPSLAQQSQTLMIPQERKTLQSALSPMIKNYLIFGAVAAVYWFFVREKPKKYTTKRDKDGLSADERDYVEGRKPLREIYFNVDKYPVTAPSLSKRAEELRKMKQRLRYKGDKEV